MTRLPGVLQEAQEVSALPHAHPLLDHFFKTRDICSTIAVKPSRGLALQQSHADKTSTQCCHITRGLSKNPCRYLDLSTFACAHVHVVAPCAHTLE
eukprot:8577281-Alexandrium_andersonii.AAC.1